MTMRFAFPNGPDGSDGPDAGPSTATRRGAAPVGTLHELPPVELAAIVYLRAWCQGSDDRHIVARDFRLVTDAAEAAAAIGDFDALMGTLLAHPRRPFMRRQLGCACFGGDESAFANLIAAAARRERDDSMLFAGILMTAPAVWPAIMMAERLGHVFLRLARVPSSAAAPAPTHVGARTAYTH